MQEKSMSKCGIYLFLLVLLSMTGCNKFKGDQEVPAYLRIDSITINPASAAAFGLTPTAKITDAWISIDGWNMGGYQLPARIPVLKRGEHEVRIQAGILVNNLSLRRGIYPFYSGVAFTVNFVEDSIINVTLKEDGTMQTSVSLMASNKYIFNEDFERGGRHQFDTVASYGSVPLVIKPCNVVSEKFPAASTSQRLYEEYVGLIHLKKDDNCCIMTKETFSKGSETALPSNVPLFVEIDYLTNNKFEVGIISTLNNKPTLHSVVVVGSQSKKDPHPQWSKIYVDLTNAITARLYEGADHFKILIRATLDEDNEDAYIYLDNIRVLFASKK